MHDYLQIQLYCIMVLGLFKAIPPNRRRCKDDLPSKKDFAKINVIRFNMCLV